MRTLSRLRVPLHPRLRSALGIIGRAWAYRRLAYALSILPLSVLYLTPIVLVTAAGLLLLPILLGIPLLAGAVALWWWLASLDRRLGARWLGIDVAPLVRPRPAEGRPGPRWWRIAVAYLGSSQTWMTLGYVLLKVPVGLLAAVVVGGLVALTAALLIAPVAVVAGVLDGTLDRADALVYTVACVSGGVLAWLAALHAARAVAWLAAALIRLMLGQGDTTQRLAVATATAERAQARADRAERSRQELIVNVGHELRTPTATIRGHVESLLLRLESEVGEGSAARPPDRAAPKAPTSPSAETLRHHLEIIQRETHRLGALIDELLTLARADSGELTLHLTPVPPAEVVEEVYQSVAPLARRERQITVTRGVERDLPVALADRQRLVQVLLNLVRNAVAYTPEGGIVAVTAEPARPGRVAFSVVDTGVGIAPEDLPHVFERFYRADPSRARASGGFGLGLAIVRDLVKAMGGSVEVESAVGEGTRFRVLLPAAP